MSNSPQNLDDLIATQVALQYVGNFLLQGQCTGHESERHWQAIKLVEAQFRAVDADIKSHPDYATRAEAQQREESERLAAQAARAKALADSQPKVGTVQPQ